MINIEQILREATAKAVKSVYNIDFNQQDVLINKTRKEFEGDFTIVVFPFVKLARSKPEAVGEALGQAIVDAVDFVVGFNVIKGFLNLSLDKEHWLSILSNINQTEKYGFAEPNSKSKVVLEYCGPNTNKPLHLGHIRNMMIGYSTANILMANGYKVHKVNILNDRGIAICKSMLAWQKFGNGATPESSGLKGDHFVGKYYVEFAAALTKQVNEMVAKGMDRDDAKKQAPLQIEAQELLRKWEAGDEATINIWKQMNNWVYDGFAVTYDKLGVDFEKEYAESEYYIKGKEIVEEGLNSGTFYKKDDGSVWVDLEDEGLDHKILLRSDGTSVYLTQDLGVAEARYEDFGMKKSIYVVADEQNYHFKVLQLCMKKLGRPYWEGIHHLSYGMVDLPGGAKMKSREGTTVDADDLVAEVIDKAKAATLESGKIEDFSAEEADTLFEKIGVGAIKFYILSVNPKKRMLFDPAKSVELDGYTASYIQYNYARIQALKNRFDKAYNLDLVKDYDLSNDETALIRQLYLFKQIVSNAGTNYDPSLIADHAYDLAKEYSRYFANYRIFGEGDVTENFRVLLSDTIGEQIKLSLGLLGIETTNRM